MLKDCIRSARSIKSDEVQSNHHYSVYDSQNQVHHQDIDKERVKERKSQKKNYRILYVMSLY